MEGQTTQWPKEKGRKDTQDFKGSIHKPYEGQTIQCPKEKRQKHK
jgi:hypothetical protein